VQQVSVWPVPSTGTVNVLLANTSATVAIQVFGMDGKMVGNEEKAYPGITRQLRIGLPGSYIIKGVNRENGETVFTRTVVVQ
jgi:hypothetical protein